MGPTQRALTQGRTSVRTRGSDGRVDTREQLHNLDPDSASQFDAEWLSHAERGLPSRSATGGGGGGRRIPIRGANDPPPEQQHTCIEEVVRGIASSCRLFKMRVDTPYPHVLGNAKLT